MCYRCSICETVVSPKTKANLVTLSTRQKHYPRRFKAHPGFEIKKDGRKVVSRRASDRVDDPGGAGWEIASQALACPGCASKAS